jgi:hypothetical protein
MINPFRLTITNTPYPIKSYASIRLKISRTPSQLLDRELESSPNLMSGLIQRPKRIKTLPFFCLNSIIARPKPMKN